MSPSWVISTKLGRNVKIAGIIRHDRKIAKTTLRPFQRSRENA